MKRRLATFTFLFSAIILATITAENSYQRLNLIYIGNSITAGAGVKTAPPALSANKLENEGYSVRYVNCGVGGSTTVDWLPQTGSLFPNALNAAASLDGTNAQLVFSIMLGTNDSAIQGPNGAPVSATKYKQNLKSIIDGLREKHPDCKIILNRPLWYSPNTHNSSTYLQEGLNRLQTYFPQIEALIQENSDYIFEGDTDAYAFFETNHLPYFQAETGNSGIFYLHPNQSGADKLADYWVTGINKHIANWGIKKSIGKKKVACIGNSITENYDLLGKDKYPSILQRFIGFDNYEVKNFGLGGRTMLSKGDAPYKNEGTYQDVLNWKPDIVIIKLGTNDAKPYNWVYKNEFQQDYINFINSFKALSNKPEIYICYPIPAFQNNWLLIDDEKTIVKEMIPMIDNAAQATGVTVIDLHTPFIDKAFMTYDLIHPNFFGTNLMAQIIGNTICPECNIVLPEDFYTRVADFDFTDKAEEFTSSVASAEIRRLINNNPLDGIKEAFSGEMWFAVKLPLYTKITGYALTSSKTDASNMPKSWILQASLTGNAWINIDMRENIQFNPLQTQIFEIEGEYPNYKYFRILIKENHGGDYLELNEWQLLGFENTFENDITSNGGTITGQYIGYPGEYVENLIDKKRDTKYCVVNKGPSWIQYNSPEAVKINRYKIASCVDIFNRNLKSWQLLGSNDNVNWDVLDERNDQDFIAKYHTVEFPANINKAYKHFRLNITEIYTGTTFQFAEWQLFEGEPVTSNSNVKLEANVFVKDGKLCVNANESLKYEVFNMSGYKVKSGVVNVGETTIANVVSGIYLVKLFSARDSQIFKMVI